MKKILILVLTVALILSLAACGGKDTATDSAGSPAEENSADQSEATLAVSDIVGTYKTANIFDTTYVFHENTTYDIESDSRTADVGKGTYTVAPNGGLELNDVEGSTHHFKSKDGYIYRTDALSYFEKDEEYGLELTLDSNGRTNQTFQSELIYSNGDRHIFALILKEDGTCEVKYNVLADKGYGERLVRESFDGTYSVENDVMTVNYNGADHTMLIEDGLLYFYVLEKDSGAAVTETQGQAEETAIAPIEEALQGAWVHETTTITFTDGRFVYDYIRVSDGKRDAPEGNYKIGEKTIALQYDSGASTEMDYTFEDGVLSLFGERGIPPVQFSYIKQ